MPKVVLHDHLDGGLRASTLVELASEREFVQRNPDFALPSYDSSVLAAQIAKTAASGSLTEYLKPFEYTVAVMQTPEAIERIAAEAVEDLADDGVVYAEIRMAPGLHTEKGLAEKEVLGAMAAGFAAGMRTASRPIQVQGLVCTLRHWDPARSLHSAHSALDAWGEGVVGFDIAGPEAGFPASDHREAFALLRDAKMPFTIHAGEADGIGSIRDALEMGARRLGHGVRIVEDIDAHGMLGSVATQVRDERIALETCPCSNAHTRAVASLKDHPLRRLVEAGFAVTVNTDNRLMSMTSMTQEYAVVRRELSFEVDELGQFARTAMQAAFCEETTKKRILALL